MDSDYGIAALVGAGLPLLIAIVLQPNWRAGVRAVVSLVLCVIGAVITNVFTDTVNFKDPNFDWVAFIGTVYGSAMVSYARFYKPTNTTPTIERKTALSGGDRVEQRAA